MSVFTVVFLHSIFIVYSSSLFQLHILHTNDIHARVEMFSARSSKCKVKDSKPDDKKTKCYGGIIRRGGFIEDFRSRNKNVLLLDAGDQYQGTMWFQVFRGHIARFYLEHHKYDAMALGNHEFDDEPQGLKPLFVNKYTSILCANLKRTLVNDDEIEASIHNHVVVTREDRQIGIIGYLTPEVFYLSKTAGIEFDDEVEAIKREIKILESKGVNIIIALGHSGIDRDKQIAKAIPDLDIVIGGHSHTLLYNGDNEAGDKVEGEYPFVIKHDDGRTTLVVTAGCFGKYIGVLNTTFDGDGNLANWSGNPVLMDEKAPEDSNMIEYLDVMDQHIQSLSGINVGWANGTFDTSDGICRITECTLGNLFADALVKILYDFCGWKNFTVGVMNGGGIRSSLGKGEITYADVAAVFPFGDQMEMVRAGGAALWEVFEHCVKGFSFTSRHGKFLQVSGLKVKYDLTKPEGERVVKLEIRKCHGCSEYVEVDKSIDYEIAMPHFIAKGGDGFTMLKTSKIRSYDIIDMEILINYLEKHSPVHPKLEGRITGIEIPPSIFKKSEVSRGTLNSYQNFVLIMVLCFSF